MDASVASHFDDRRGPALLRVMVVAATAAFVIWIVTGAYGWRGYPAEHDGGRLVATILGLLCLVILLTIAWTTIAPQPPTRRTLLIAIVCWSTARLVTTSLFPLGSDEAYHWLWARHLDLCYYDHPAMVAWLARLFAPFGGEATALVRLSPIVLGAFLPAATAYLAWITVRDAGVAIRSAILFMLTPILSGSTFLMPALPVICFWTLAAIQFWRAAESGRHRDWLLLGLAFGAALNCNFTTFLFPLCILAYLLVSPLHRRYLMKPGPYVALAVAAACFVPVIAWNAQHDWRTFGFNFFRRHRELSFHADQLGLYLGQLLLFVSPALAVGMIIASFNSLRGLTQSAIPCALRYLAIMGLAPILAFLVTSAALKARAHYAAPAVIPLIVLFVWQVHRGVLRRWFRPAALVGLGFTVCFWCGLLLTALVPAPAMHRLFAKLGAKDPDKPTAELYGWSALGEYLDAAGVELNAESPTVVIALSYSQASLVMHYSRNVEFAFGLDEGRSPYGQQFQFWGPLDKIPLGCDAILFRAGRVPDINGYVQELARRFERVEPVDTTDSAFDPTLRYFTICRGWGYRGGLAPTRP